MDSLTMGAELQVQALCGGAPHLPGGPQGPHQLPEGADSQGEGCREVLCPPLCLFPHTGRTGCLQGALRALFLGPLPYTQCLCFFCGRRPPPSSALLSTTWPGSVIRVNPLGIFPDQGAPRPTPRRPGCEPQARSCDHVVVLTESLSISGQKGSLGPLPGTHFSLEWAF